MTYGPGLYPPLSPLYAVPYAPPNYVNYYVYYTPSISVNAPDDTVRKPVAAPERPLPGAPASVFRPVDAANRVRALQPENGDRPKPAEKRGPKRAADRKPPELPRTPHPEADPKAESARLIKLGREAFAAQEYGRAAQRFEQAITTAADPAAHFLLAQSYLALGKYREAVDEIATGLRLQPDWPTSDFRPRELYGKEPGTFEEHMQRLEEVRARHPNDALLLFLSAYEMWFDGCRKEAWPLFQQARNGVPEKAAVEAFLNAGPP